MTRTNLSWVATAFGVMALTMGHAQALPAFAAQTGQPCSSCHVGSFGPQLTPFGRAFKLSGYTVRTVSGSIPVSAIIVSSYLWTQADQPAPPAPHFGTNNNVALDQASLFLAGGVNSNFGAFGQFTYDGIGHSFAWDNLDLRATDQLEIGKTDVEVGLSLNNNPTVQDPWNTSAAWGFPYTDSALAPSPAAATIINGGLAQSVLGLSGYAWWDSEIYTEAGLYWTPGRGFMRAMGADGGAVLKGAAPYIRVAYQKDFGEQNFEFGASAFLPNLFPGGDRTASDSDKYQDLGVDASYQLIGDGSNIYQINMRYTHEQQRLDATYALEGAANPRNTLNEFQTDASYYWHNMIGGTVSYFNSWGSTDSLLYPDSRISKPDSQGFIFQVDGTPFGNSESSLDNRFNIRLGLQYRVFTRFDGASRNYDGLGRNSSDNNTLRIFSWIAL